ncbi:MAG: GNAT family N-acetyltransferase [Alistipes sp.]|nr:GNAT family N-acetyltransferase [Alistipes sp.]
MKILVYDYFPDYAKEIRREVFTNEQGFQNEFDETDNTAAHFVLFEEKEEPIATCRVFWNEEMEAYTLGRLAVIKKYRGRNMGSVMVKEAEKYVREKGGKKLILHAQCRAADFYKKLGFEEFGDVGDEEGCPHIWMKKSV